MKKRVTIARALKEKNRVAGRLAKARELVGRENSMDKNVPRGIDVSETYTLAKTLRDRLVSIKSAIAEANSPIVSKIIELDEVKSEISYLNGLDVKEGKFVETNYGSRIDPIYALPYHIARHIEEPLKVEDLAEYCGLSYPWFARKFRDIYGISCKEYIENVRIRRVEHYLQFTDCDLNYISEHTGYADCSHLIRDFRKLRNTTPGQFRKDARKKPQGEGQFPQNY